MKAPTFVVVSLVTVMASAVALAQPKDDKQKADFCSALSDFHADIKTLDKIGPQSTMAELRAAIDRSDMDAQKVMKAAGKMSSPSATAFTTQAKKLKSDASNLPDSMTIDQAKSKLQDDIKAVKDAAMKLAGESNCTMQGMNDPDKDKPTDKDKPMGQKQ